MLSELVIRFLLGGVIVSVFSVIGDSLKPKSFAGIFGAAPSVALATLGIAFIKHGGSYAATEGHSMIAGAVALFVYSLWVGKLVQRRRTSGWLLASASWTVWLAVAFLGWGGVLR